MRRDVLCLRTMQCLGELGVLFSRDDDGITETDITGL